MINFILPHCFHNDNFNCYLREYIRIYPNRLNFPERVNIFAQQGNFPFSFWHGGINTNIKTDKLMLYPNLNDYSNHLSMPVILDFSNIYLPLIKTWIYDTHVQMTLKLFNNQGNYIKVSSNEIKLQIQEFFPNYNFILKNECIDINNNKDYEFFETQNLNFQNHNKIIYSLRDKCKYCDIKCHEEEQLYQFSFSEQSVRTDCVVTYPNLDAVKNDYENARKQGYVNFSFGDMPVNDIQNFNNFLIHFFIKPEFHQFFLEGLL